jgi:putative LysE/RhtB family amino acid efflux pump
MSLFFIFLKAFIIGFSIAMPVGPIGLLCIKNTLSYGFKIGVAVGLGAALADSFYGFLAGGGLALISELLLDYITYIKIIGGIFLIYLGLKEIINYKKIPHQAADVKGSHFFKTIFTVLFLTLTNPATIISFVAIFAVIGGASTDGSGLFTMILGVFFGSLCWWLILAGGVSKIKHKISENIMKIIKIFSGIILCGFGIYAVIL